MIVCSCRAVRESTVRNAVAAGARTVEDVAARCGAGSVCGGCHDTLAHVLAEAAVAVRGASSSAA